MNIEDGSIHHMNDEETALFVQDKQAALAALSARIGVEEDKLVPLDRLPSADCPKCKGKGRIKAGMQSKRFKPCKCTILKMLQEKREQEKAHTSITFGT